MGFLFSIAWWQGEVLQAGDDGRTQARRPGGPTTATPGRRCQARGHREGAEASAPINPSARRSPPGERKPEGDLHSLLNPCFTM